MIVRVERDDPYIDLLRIELEKACERIEREFQRLKEL